MIRVEIIERLAGGELTTPQAATVLGLSERHVRRLKRRYERAGPDGILDGRAARMRRQRLVRAGEASRIVQLKLGRYAEFSVRHFYDHVTTSGEVTASYSTVLRVLQRAGLVAKLSRRGTYRRKRARQPMVGMRVHLDASMHAWLGDSHPTWDLMVALDDADGRILAARFVDEEGTLATLQILAEVLTRYGRFGELYTDRGSHFVPHSDEESKNHQVQRVLKTLHIRHRVAYSPEARGRSERAFGTLQNRLPQELRFHRITTMADANRYLREVFVPDFNQRFTVTPEEPHTAFAPLPGVDLSLVLSIQTERTVHSDTTLRFEGRSLQLPRAAAHLTGRKVTVHRFLDGSLGVSYDDRLVAFFKADGTPQDAPKRSAPIDDRPLPQPPQNPDRRLSEPSDSFWNFLNSGPNLRGDLFIVNG